jgi:DNA-3-methyladenine glycosylase II
LIVRPVAPFRLDLTAWVLRRRSRNAIDRWDGTTYRRTVVVDARVTELAIRQTSAGATPRLSVTATPSLRTTADRRAAPG